MTVDCDPTGKLSPVLSMVKSKCLGALSRLCVPHLVLPVTVSAGESR